MRQLLLFLAAAAFALTTPGISLAGQCPGSCWQTCAIAGCKAALCRCFEANWCAKSGAGCTGGGSTIGETTPIQTTTKVSLTAAGASFKNDLVAVFEDGTAWSVVVDVGVSDFTVTDEWVDDAWYSVAADILTDAGLCWSTNSGDHEITVSNC